MLRSAPGTIPLISRGVGPAPAWMRLKWCACACSSGLYVPVTSESALPSCSRCVEAGESHGCDWCDASFGRHLLEVDGEMWQVVSPGAGCSACAVAPERCRLADVREVSPWFVCLVLKDNNSGWRLAEKEDHVRAVDVSCCLGDVSELPLICLGNLRRAVHHSVCTLQDGDAPTRGPPKATMASDMLVQLGVRTQLELHGRQWPRSVDQEAPCFGFKQLSAAPLVLAFRLARSSRGAAAEVVFLVTLDPHSLSLIAPMCLDAVPPRRAQYVLASAIGQGSSGQYFCMFSLDGAAGTSWGGDAGPLFGLGHELVGVVYVLETHSELSTDGSVSRNTVTRAPASPVAETYSLKATAVGQLCAPCGGTIGVGGVTLCCAHRLCAACWQHAVAFAVQTTPAVCQPATYRVVCPVCVVFGLVNPETVSRVNQQITDSQVGPPQSGNRSYFVVVKKATTAANHQAKHASALIEHLSHLLKECATPLESADSAATTSALVLAEAAHRGTDGKCSWSSMSSPTAEGAANADTKRLHSAAAQAVVPADPALAQSSQRSASPVATPSATPESGDAVSGQPHTTVASPVATLSATPERGEVASGQPHATVAGLSALSVLSAAAADDQHEQSSPAFDLCTWLAQSCLEVYYNKVVEWGYNKLLFLQDAT